MFFQDGAWGVKEGGKFVPKWTDEEYQFRVKALEQIQSGKLDADAIVRLQQECVRRAQLSIYSWARRG